MGLDMYLSKKLYLWQDTRGDLKITGLPVKIRPQDVKQIEAEAGYWRKANAIHQWFVDNVQDGQDDCKEYYVSREQLKELLKAVNKVIRASKLVDGQVHMGTRFANGQIEEIIEPGKVIENPEVAQEVLPTQEGFFFGGTDYNEYYIKDLKETRKIIEKALREPEDWEFYYQSSW